MRVGLRGRLGNQIATWGCIAAVLMSGCSRVKDFRVTNDWTDAPSFRTSTQTKIEYPSVQSCLEPNSQHTPLPHSLENPSELPAIPMSLNEAIQMALSKGEILRSLGGSVVATGSNTASTYDPALVESGAGGVETALSRFDAQVSSQLFWAKNNQPNNTTFLVFQPIASEQTLGNFNYALSKRTATGATWTARHSMIYNRNNSPARFFASDFTGFFEAQYRQPLLLGAGIQYNQIAGPGSGIGSYNGVLIARIRTDISLADFESSVINFVRDVETAYWDLYFAYHNLEAQVAGRNSSLLTWQRIKELQKVGARGGDAAAEAQARSQYYTFDVAVKDALT
ncbi:MAG: TolC family protein, partial [Planctomycetota bacterium]